MTRSPKGTREGAPGTEPRTSDLRPKRDAPVEGGACPLAFTDANSRLVSRFTDGIVSVLRSERPNLRTFVREAWPILEPATPYLPSKYIDDLVYEHLEAVFLRQIQNLIINMPPRYGKSLRATVLFPVWVWTRLPSRRFMFASFSGSLSTKHSVDRRRVIESPWYQERWGGKVRLQTDQNVKTEFENTARGHMIATSVGGAAGGKGGDTLILDDTLSPMEAESKASREAAKEFVDGTWSFRMNDKKTGANILVEHRLHHQDVTDHMLKQGGWEHLDLQAIADKRTVYVLPRSGRKLEREAAEPLWPEREPLPVLLAQKKKNTRKFNAQCQQRPVPAKGRIVQRAWFKRYRALPEDLTYRLWSWDTASKKGEHNDYSVGGYWVRNPTGIYLVHVVRERMRYPELKRRVRDVYDARKSDCIKVEDKSSGQELIPDLQSETDLPIVPGKPAGDKVARLEMVASTIAAGNVYLPDQADWVDDFLEEVCAFPEAPHDDQVDMTSQALLHLRELGGGMGDSAGGTYNPTPGRSPGFGRFRWRRGA